MKINENMREKGMIASILAQMHKNERERQRSRAATELTVARLAVLSKMYPVEVVHSAKFGRTSTLSI